MIGDDDQAEHTDPTRIDEAFGRPGEKRPGGRTEADGPVVDQAPASTSRAGAATPAEQEPTEADGPVREDGAEEIERSKL